MKPSARLVKNDARATAGLRKAAASVRILIAGQKIEHEALEALVNLLKLVLFLPEIPKTQQEPKTGLRDLEGQVGHREPAVVDHPPTEIDAKKIGLEAAPGLLPLPVLYQPQTQVLILAENAEKQEMH